MNAVAINAAKIALLMEPDDSSTDQCLRIVESATRLYGIEKSNGFRWEDQRNDWESVCFLIAEHLTKTGRAVDQETISGYIKKGTK